MTGAKRIGNSYDHIFISMGDAALACFNFYTSCPYHRLALALVLLLTVPRRLSTLAHTDSRLPLLLRIAVCWASSWAMT